MNRIHAKRNSIKGVAQRLLCDPQFIGATVIGLLVVVAMRYAGLSTTQGSGNHYWGLIQFAIAFPLLEEIVFRGLIQGALLRRLRSRIGPFSLANIATSLLFVAAHLLYHTPLWAVAVFIPSLLFGYFYDRYQHLLPPILLHVLYNSVFLLLLQRS